jgi:hypothetical protein
MERDHWENTDVIAKMILKCILEKQDGEFCCGFIWFSKSNTGGLIKCHRLNNI